VDFEVVALELVISFLENLSSGCIRQSLASQLDSMAACKDLHLDFSSEKSTDVKKPKAFAMRFDLMKMV
jgi:hypothetical protein